MKTLLAIALAVAFNAYPHGCGWVPGAEAKEAFTASDARKLVAAHKGGSREVVSAMPPNSLELKKWIQRIREIAADGGEHWTRWDADGWTRSEETEAKLRKLGFKVTRFDMRECKGKWCVTCEAYCTATIISWEKAEVRRE